MKIFWICAFLIVSAVYADHAIDYDDYYGSLEDLEKLTKDYEQINEKTDIENDLKVEEEIQEFRKEEEKDNIDSIDDYQFEDNRDKHIIDDLEGDNVQNLEKDEVKDAGVDQEDNRPEEHNQNADYALLWGDDNIAPLPIPDENVIDDTVDEALLEETLKILEEPGADDFDDSDKEEKSDSGFGEDNENLEINEETQKILEEVGADTFDDTDNNDEIKSTESNQDIKEQESEEDTVDKAYEDLNAHLDELFNTLDKLKQAVKDEDIDNNMESADDGNDEAQSDNANDEIKGSDQLDGDIEENNKILEETKGSDDNKQDDNKEEEGTLDKTYEDLNTDLEKLFDTLDKLEEGNEKIEKFNDELDDLLDWDDFENSDDEVPVDFDKLMENIKEEDDINYNIDLTNDEMNEPNPDDAKAEDTENIFDDKIVFGDDALVDDLNQDSEEDNKEENNNAKSEKAQENNDATTDNNENITENVFKTALLEELNSSQLEDLVSQFSILHSEDLDIHSQNFAEKNTAPVHITLKVDEPTIITSPDYPNPYPTNNVVDWIISGVGEGIELNITEFAVNGALGDYLLIKPGGIDESGHDGLIFTYRLNEERRYRFTDVDRMFMRFEAKIGMMFFRGFSISAKMIAPISTLEEDIPEPEPVVTPPHSTLTVHLATSVLHFQEVREEFTSLLADMASLYVRENDVDPGVNATSEVTKITSVRLCPVSWPNFEQCVAVTFGVSLVYEEEADPRLDEEDLRSMWLQYSDEEPFASKLEKLGLYVFLEPSSAVLTSWMLIAAAVIALMALVAAALWRFSCFEGYTRMRAYSDTDSVNEKRTLDLYPTPHQTLPPLYAENEYKWPQDHSTTVDMGGFANRSYATDNIYDLDSDEDVIPQRDRNATSKQSKDISNV